MHDSDSCSSDSDDGLDGSECSLPSPRLDCPLPAQPEPCPRSPAPQEPPSNNLCANDNEPCSNAQFVNQRQNDARENVDLVHRHEDRLESDSDSDSDSDSTSSSSSSSSDDESSSESEALEPLLVSPMSEASLASPDSDAASALFSPVSECDSFHFVNYAARE